MHVARFTHRLILANTTSFCLGMSGPEPVIYRAAIQFSAARQ